MLQDRTSVRPIDHDVTDDVPLRERVLQLQREVTTLREGLESRQHIGFVTGVLAQRYGVQPDAAWALLSDVSQHLNVKARVVAEVLMAAYCGRLSPDDVPLAARITGLLPPVPVS